MTVVQRVFKDLPQKPGGLNAIQQSPYNKCPKATYAIVLVLNSGNLWEEWGSPGSYVWPASASSQLDTLPSKYPTHGFISTFWFRGHKLLMSDTMHLHEHYLTFSQRLRKSNLLNAFWSDGTKESAPGNDKIWSDKLIQHWLHIGQTDSPGLGIFLLKQITDWEASFRTNIVVPMCIAPQT